MAFLGGTFTLKMSLNIIACCIPEVLDLFWAMTLLGVLLKEVTDSLDQNIHIPNKICIKF